MKLTVTQENLRAGLTLAAPIAQKGGSLPILQNILLTAKDGSLMLSATNLEIGLTVYVRGKIEQEGTFTVHGRLFSEYVNLLNADKVDIKLDGENIRIKAGGQQTKIHGQNADEFPVIPTIDGIEPIRVDGSLLREALSQVLFSVAVSDTRPEISGVLVTYEDKTLTFVGTDSYRLAEKKITLNSAVPKAGQVIIPLRTVQELARILGHVAGEASIYITDNQIGFRIGDAELVSRVIVGNYPDYTQIIPKQAHTTVTLDKEPLVRAIKSAALFCKQGLNHISLQFSSDKILVSASASQLGENTIEVPAKITGKDVDIVFDYRFLLDGLAAIVGSEVTIKLETSNNPGILVPQTAGYLYLVMPIKQ